MMVTTRGFTAIALVAAVACGGKQPVQLSPTVDPSATRWNASLGTPEGLRGVVQAQGTASLSAARTTSQSMIDINLANMSPGGVHPWKLQSGQCGQGRADLVRVTDGQLLKVGGDGKAHADATVDLPFPSSGDYFIAVLASVENQEQVIACGNLAPPTSAPVRTSY